MIDYTLSISIFLSVVAAVALIVLVGTVIGWVSDKLKMIKYLESECRSLQRQLYKKQDKLDGR